MNIKEIINESNTGEKIILIGGCISVLSLFMDWVDIGIMAVDGFQQNGYILILFLLYPIFQAIKRREAVKKISIFVVGISILIMLYLISDKSTEFFGTTVNLAASGMYIMLISQFIVLVGVFLNNRKTNTQYDSLQNLEN